MVQDSYPSWVLRFKLTPHKGPGVFAFGSMALAQGSVWPGIARHVRFIGISKHSYFLLFSVTTQQPWHSCKFQNESALEGPFSTHIMDWRWKWNMSFALQMGKISKHSYFLLFSVIAEQPWQSRKSQNESAQLRVHLNTTDRHWKWNTSFALQMGKFKQILAFIPTPVLH